MAAGNPISARPSPPESFQAVTPSDSTLLAGFQWLRVGVAGNLVVQGPNDASSVTIAVGAAEYVPFAAGYVKAATTATGIVAFG